MKKYKLLVCVSLIVSIMLIYVSINLHSSTNHLKVNEFTYTSPKITKEMRLVVLADLHDHRFGSKNETLIQKVLEQKPDMVLLVGDLLNEDSESAQVPCELIRGLREKLPEDVFVYFALGNHEMAYREQNPKLLSEIWEAGAVVLDKAYVDIEVQENRIRLGGMYDYAFGLDGFDGAESAPEEVRCFLEDYQDTESLKLMMAHRPDSFVFGNAAEYWDVDLVVSGHVHGGQVVLPFLGGVWGMDQGWFPEYEHGLYEKGQMHVFVTSGLGSSEQVIPRFQNPPEIAVLRLKNG